MLANTFGWPSTESYQRRTEKSGTVVSLVPVPKKMGVRTAFWSPGAGCNATATPMFCYQTASALDAELRVAPPPIEWPITLVFLVQSTFGEYVGSVFAHSIFLN